MKKTLLLLSLLAVSAAEAADVPSEPQNQPAPELQVKTAEPDPVEAEAAKPAAETSSEKVVNVDAKTLLDNPQLLSRAMYSAVVSRNIAGIKVVLPIYEQWQGHDKNMALYARGLVAQNDGKMKEAIGYYRQFIAENPDAPVVRWQLATALFEDKQNEAAADQFDKLKTEPNLPEPFVKGIESYRKALRERDSWKFNAGLSVTREQNINQAPSRRTYGNWTFPEPIDATAINYQLGAEKKWSLPKGWYATAGADTYGKVYPERTKYNDVTTRFSVGAGYADQHNDIGLTPFHERRFYGNDPYTYSSGARLHINHWWQPKLQTLSAVEMGRLKNTRTKSISDDTLIKYPPFPSIRPHHATTPLPPPAPRQVRPARSRHFRRRQHPLAAFGQRHHPKLDEPRPSCRTGFIVQPRNDGLASVYRRNAETHHANRLGRRLVRTLDRQLPARHQANRRGHQSAGHRRRPQPIRAAV